jgi:hypothetical protein
MIGESEKSEQKTWIGRAVAICTGVAAIAAAAGVFLTNAGSILDRFTRTPATLEIRDVRTIGPMQVWVPFSDIVFPALGINFVAEKKGDKELRKCEGELYWNGQIEKTAQPQTFDFRLM